MPTKLKPTKRAPGAAYGSAGPKGRARRSLRTDAGKLKVQTSKQKVKKKTQQGRRTGTGAAAASGSARGSPARSVGPNGGANAAAESPAVRAEILRLKREIATKNEEISDAVQVGVRALLLFI